MTEPIRGAGPFQFKIAEGNLQFRRQTVNDPVPTGRQILEGAGFRTADEHLLLQILEDGALESIRLDEGVDLRQAGREKFIAFRSDRSFRFVLDGRGFEWGAAEITEDLLKGLAGVGEEAGIWLELRDEPDRMLEAGEAVSLEGAEIERFRTGSVFFVCIEDEIYPWPRNTITTEEIAKQGGWDVSLGVILVDEDQNERQLEPGEEVKLEPGISFGKKHCFKRG